MNLYALCKVGNFSEYLSHLPFCELRDQISPTFIALLNNLGSPRPGLVHHLTKFCTDVLMSKYSMLLLCEAIYTDLTMAKFLFLYELCTQNARTAPMKCSIGTTFPKTHQAIAVPSVPLHFVEFAQWIQVQKDCSDYFVFSYTFSIRLTAADCKQRGIVHNFIRHSTT